MSNSTQSTNILKDELLKVHKAFEAKSRQQSFLNASLLIIGWFISFILIEHVFYLPVEVKIASIIGILVLSIVLLRRSYAGVKKKSFIQFYREFSASTNLKELSYALDLEKNSIANPKLVEAAIFRNLELVEPSVFQKSLNDFKKQNSVTINFNRQRVLLSLLLLIGVITVVNFNDAASRYLAFYQTFEKPNPFIFTVQPGNATLEQGSPFVVSVTFDNNLLPDEVSLYLKTPIEEEYRKRGMDSNQSTFNSSAINLNSDVSYYLLMDGYKTETYDVKVQLRPRLVDFQVNVIPPIYTKQDTITFEYPFSQVQGIQGSQMILSGKVNKPLNEFLVKNTEFEQDALISQDLEFEYAAEIIEPDTIEFILEDESGLLNKNPFQFIVEPILDEYPFAEILEPSNSFEEIEPREINILYRTSDDFGITKASLHYELKRAFVQNAEAKSYDFENVSEGVLQNHVWNIESLNLKPKDELTFWIEAQDNDRYNGFKTSRSNAVTLTIPSLIDYFEELDEKEEEVQTDLEDISENFEEMEQQYEMFKEQLREDPEIDYQDMRQLQEVKERQEQIKEQLDELNEKFNELKEELNENDLLSEETLQAYDELQKLMEEIDDPAFREALEMLQENMNSMTPEQLREAMENTEFNEELYKQRIERTIELFKQLKLNSELERLAKTYEDLARQVEEESNSEGSQEQQESILEQTEQAEELLQNLDENTTSKTEGSINELQELSEQKLNEIKEALQSQESDGNQNSDSDSSDQSTESGEDDEENNQEQEGGNSESQPQNQIQQDFQELAEMTRGAMSQMNQEQLNINIAGLQYILYSLINLSLEQEELTTYASGAESRSQAYVGFARDQKNVENIFNSISDSLFQLSKEIPAFSNQINTEKLEVERLIEQALVQMAERNQSRSSVATRQALGGINKISYQIANLLEQLQNQSGGGSGSGMSMQQMIKQMQQMGENQQQINQQIQDFINDMQGDRLTQDQMERLNQLSRQQNEMRKQLQEMQQNGGVEGGDQLGSDLERMIEQMEETINDLRGGAVDPTLIERQQNILSRMLEAEDAMQERDEEERREGSAGESIERISPPEMTLEELEQQIRNRLNDPNFTKYSPDYQQLIQRYFELLKELQNREIQ